MCKTTFLMQISRPFHKLRRVFESIGLLIIIKWLFPLVCAYCTILCIIFSKYLHLPIYIHQFFQFSDNCLQDEVLAISDKVVIRADDLLNWCDDTINWRWGLRAATTPKCDSIVKTETLNDDIKIERVENESKVTTAEREVETPVVRSLKNSFLDFNDIEMEKGK